MIDPAGMLKDILFVSVPDAFNGTIGDFRIDPDIMLPVEIHGDPEEWNVHELSWESIIAGMLKILGASTRADRSVTYDAFEDIEYYRRFVFAARPAIVDELSETGVIKANNRDFELAEEIFAALVGLVPDDPRALLNLALVCDQRSAAYADIENQALENEYAEYAVQWYDQVMRFDSVPSEAYLNRGHFFLRRHDYALAHADFSAYLTVEPEGDFVDQARTIVEQIESQNLLDRLFRDAYEAIRSNDERRGIELITKFLAAYPDVWNAWFLLGWAHRRLGEFAVAERAFRRSLELGPRQPDTLNEIAICTLEQGNFTESHRLLKEALSIEPENTKIISNLGILALKLGDKITASAFFRTVADLDPQDAAARRYLELLSD